MNNQKGQAAVEFTLIAMLLLIVAWIPTDFGLAFYTAQQAQNAAREGARIAAADPAVKTQIGNCTLATCYSTYSATPTHPLYRAATRASAALMPDTSVSLTVNPTTGCNQMVVMTVSGTYNFFFYRLIRWFGFSPNPVTITRSSSVRWEHQC